MMNQETRLRLFYAVFWDRFLPSTPEFCPELGLLSRIWGELVTVKAIAGVDLQ